MSAVDAQRSVDDALAVLAVDADCLVVAKPAGMLSVPGRGPSSQDCLLSRLQVRFGDLFVVHRLDMATSGLIVFARSAEAQRRLNRAFAERAVEKRYVATVDGEVAADSGEIDLPLASDWPNRPRQRVDPVAGKPSVTRYRVLERSATCTRLSLSPVTGRSHQLRVHLLALGHPILGDALYAPDAVRARAERLLLHAEGLAFAHPGSGAWSSFSLAAPF